MPTYWSPEANAVDIFGKAMAMIEPSSEAVNPIKQSERMTNQKARPLVGGV